MLEDNGERRTDQAEDACDALRPNVPDRAWDELQTEYVLKYFSIYVKNVDSPESTSIGFDNCGEVPKNSLGNESVLKTITDAYNDQASNEQPAEDPQEPPSTLSDGLSDDMFDHPADVPKVLFDIEMPHEVSGSLLYSVIEIKKLDNGHVEMITLLSDFDPWVMLYERNDVNCRNNTIQDLGEWSKFREPKDYGSLPNRYDPSTIGRTDHYKVLAACNWLAKNQP